MRKMTWARVPRLACFGLLLSGFLLTLCGQIAEASSNTMPQSVFLLLDDGTSAYDYNVERRSRAEAFKSAGFLLALAGPPVWLIGRLSISRTGTSPSKRTC